MLLILIFRYGETLIVVPERKVSRFCLYLFFRLLSNRLITIKLIEQLNAIEPVIVANTVPEQIVIVFWGVTELLKLKIFGMMILVLL